MYFPFHLYFPHWKVDAENKTVSWFIKLMNLQAVLGLSFSRVFLGGWR